MRSRLSEAFGALITVPAILAAIVVFAFVKLLQENRQRRREMARLNAEARGRQHRRRVERRSPPFWRCWRGHPRQPDPGEARQGEAKGGG